MDYINVRKLSATILVSKRKKITANQNFGMVDRTMGVQSKK